MEQIRIEAVYGDVNITTAPPTCDQNVKLSEEDKKWLADIGNAVSAATGNAKYGASSVAREAIKFYRAFHQHRQKLLRYRKAVISMLENLP